MVIFDTRKTEFRFFLLYTAFVIYGSLYPFDFISPKVAFDSWEKILFIKMGTGFSLQDVFTNLVLFMPFGYLGVQAIKEKVEAIYSPFLITLLCLPLAHGLQIMQFFIKGRIPSSQDTLLNLAGCFIASIFPSAVKVRYPNHHIVKQKEFGHSAFLLGMLWLAYNVAPFVPSLDIDSLKHGIKPLLYLSFSPLESFVYMMGWLLFGILCKDFLGELSGKFFAIIIVAVLGCRIIVDTRSLDLNTVVGGVGALFFLKDGPKIGEKMLLVLLIMALSLEGLSPFEFSSHAREFHLVPFYGVLGGNWIYGMIIIFKKLFFYGAFLWLLWRQGLGFYTSLIIATGWSGTIEILQMWSRFHTPEITDPILILIMGYVIKWSDKKGKKETKIAMASG